MNKLSTIFCLPVIFAQSFNISDTNCENYSNTEVIAGPIWPAYGHVKYIYPNDNEQLQPESYVIIPPADCQGSNCWRANVTCEFSSNLIRNYNPKNFQVTWKWYWTPEVQYPLGNKNFYEDNKNSLLFNQTTVQLETQQQVWKNSGKTFPNTGCPTNYTFYANNPNQYIKFCPIYTEALNKIEQAENKGVVYDFSSTMIIYDYLNEQDDGKYVCRPIIEDLTAKRRDNKFLATNIKPCEITVYYASPIWNTWCWIGMIYAIGGGSILLYFVGKLAVDSKYKVA